jgi:hypothetical protein
MSKYLLVTPELVDAWDREINDDPLLSLSLFIQNWDFKSTWVPASRMIGKENVLTDGWAIFKVQVRQGLRVMAEGQLLYNPTTDMTMVIPGKGRSDALLAISLIDNKEVDYRPDGMIPEDYYAL